MNKIKKAIIKRIARRYARKISNNIVDALYIPEITTATRKFYKSQLKSAKKMSDEKKEQISKLIADAKKILET